LHSLAAGSTGGKSKPVPISRTRRNGIENASPEPTPANSATVTNAARNARAVGYNYEAVKIFMPAGHNKPEYAPYIEHVPPDVAAGIFWMKNRDPQHWRDSQQLDERTPTTRSPVAGTVDAVKPLHGQRSSHDEHAYLDRLTAPSNSIV
jgi:hypothetical protein